MLRTIPSIKNSLPGVQTHGHFVSFYKPPLLVQNPCSKFFSVIKLKFINQFSKALQFKMPYDNKDNVYHKDWCNKKKLLLKMSCIMRKPAFYKHVCENRRRSAVTVQLISAFVFAT